jgi:type II secretion system protein C
VSSTRLIETLLSLVTPVAVILCAYFVASGVSDYVATRAIGEATAAERPVRRAPVAPSPVARSKSGVALVERNMFCSTCEASSSEPGLQVAAATGAIPDTDLPLRLLATSVSTDPDSSFASIANTQSSHQGAFWSGDAIPGAGPIDRITGRSVVFTNTALGRLERLRIDDVPPPAAAPEPKKNASTRRVARRPPRNNPTAELAAAIEANVREVGANTWEVDRSVIASLKGNPQAFRGIRILPHVENGKASGFKVTQLSARSPISKIGVKRGDVISAVNGAALTGPDKVLQMMTQINTLSRVEITVMRGGKPVNLTYLLR